MEISSKYKYWQTPQLHASQIQLLEKMKYYWSTATLLLLCYVEGVLSDCKQDYQQKVQDLIAVRKICNGAVLKDCCQASRMTMVACMACACSFTELHVLLQVKQLLPSVRSGSYEVADVCNTSASFLVTPNQYAYCDMETDGGKWLVIQRRINGSVDFYRNWVDYVNGFGDLEGEFWYGLEKTHCLTTREDVELRIEQGNGTTPTIVWTYQLFRVQDASTNYRLTIGQGQGTGYDAMTEQNGQAFSTKDRDNDGLSSNCAVSYGGAWWFNKCHHSNLNGRYGYHQDDPDRIAWYDGTAYRHYTNVEMKIRPKRCSSLGNAC